MNERKRPIPFLPLRISFSLAFTEGALRGAIYLENKGKPKAASLNLKAGKPQKEK